MDIQNMELPRGSNEYSGVKGISNIDHRERCKKGLNVSEYVVYNFIEKFRESYPDDKINESDVWQNIGFTLSEFLQICEVLMSKDLVQCKKGVVKLSSTSVKKKVAVNPTEDEVVKYFKENGYKESAAKTAFKMYNVADWHDTRGNKIINWKQKMISVWFKPENEEKLSQKPEPSKMRGSIYD